uniref:Uncharacterized protein n=1 Tax=Aegilops tauschii subsp. strangulata TaxID=200361 RepID=A0A453BBR5_AEGTS
GPTPAPPMSHAAIQSPSAMTCTSNPHRRPSPSIHVATAPPPRTSAPFLEHDAASYPSPPTPPSQSPTTTPPHPLRHYRLCFALHGSSASCFEGGGPSEMLLMVTKSSQLKN